jgi:hypothetical protein
MKTYKEGAAQCIALRMLGYTGIKIVTPTVRFIDEETEIAWSMFYFKKHKPEKEWLVDIIKYRRSECHETRIILRREGQRRHDALQRDPFIKRMRKLPLTPDALKYDRAIGVEIECVRPFDAVVNLPIWARVGPDGSIQDRGKGVGSEYKILLKRSELEVRLHKLCGLIKDHHVNTSCGLHIHLDCRDKTDDEVRKIAKRMDSWLKALQEFVPESRRTNSYCKFGFSVSDRYRAVNYTSFGKFKTLEIRLHSGTVDYTKIIAWIRLLELLFAYNVKPKSGATGIAALAQLPMAEYERSYWIKRHAQLNPRQYNSQAPIVEVE